MDYNKIIYEKALKAISEFKMLNDVNGVLVGFSGGADSSALLYFMNEFCCSQGIKLYAVHINHLIRGDEARRDQSFCESFCMTQDIRLFTHIEDVPKLAEKNGESLEEAARNVRYRIFDELVDQYDEITHIATAHNSDDNMETVIFNMFRGTGIKGLCGIPPIRNKNIIRPFIYCTKQEIIGYCTQNNIDFITDSTNTDIEYTRNFIRHEIIPKIYKINSSPEQAISKLCSLLRQDDEFIFEYSQNIIDCNKITNIADRNFLISQKDVILSRIILFMYKYSSNSTNNTLNYENINNIIQFIRKGEKWRRLCLPNQIIVYINNDKIQFITEKNYDQNIKSKLIYEHKLDYGANNFGNIGAFVYITLNYDEKYIKQLKNIYKLFKYISVNFDKINGNIFIRSRIDGDKYIYSNMTHKIKKLFQDKKISPEEKNFTPLFCDNNGIFWLPGFGVRDDVKNDDLTTNKLHIFFGKV